MKQFIFILFFPFLLIAQAPAIQWQKAYGGEGNDGGWIIIATKTGGYLLVGNSKSDIGFEKSENSITDGDEYNSTDIWIIKINDIGAIEWQQTIGGTSDDGASSAIQTRDGNYFILGHSASQISGDKTVPEEGIWMLKINTVGDIIWQRGFDEISTLTWPGENDFGNFLLTNVIETADNGLLFGGMAISQPCCTTEDIPQKMMPNTNTKNTSIADPVCSGADILLVKLDAAGNYLWEKLIKGNYQDELKTIKETTDGGLIIGAISNSTVSFDKTETSYITETSIDCNLINLNNDFWIIKTNSIGEIEWQNTIGGNNVDYLHSMHITTNGYTFLGDSRSTISGDKTVNNIHATGDQWKVNLDLEGNIVSQSIVPIGSDVDDFSTSKITLMDSNENLYIISWSLNWDEEGTSENTTSESIYKLDSADNIIWNRTINTSPQSDIGDMTFAPDGGLLTLLVSAAPVGGDKTEFCRGESDFWLVKFETESLANTTNKKVDFNAFPNPTSNEITITFNNQKEKSILKLHNVLGQLVSSNSFSNLQSITYPIVGEKGVYFLSVETENSEKQTIKIIKE